MTTHPNRLALAFLSNNPTERLCVLKIAPKTINNKSMHTSMAEYEERGMEEERKESTVLHTDCLHSIYCVDC